MALPNIIDEKRNIVTILIFIMRVGLKASKKFSILRIISAILGTTLNFVQIGALSIVVNEFVSRGVADARPTVLIVGIGSVILFQFLPSVFQHLEEYYWSGLWNLSRVEVSKSIQMSLERIDMATIEQPEFKNKLHLANSRGINSVMAGQNWVIEIIKYSASLIVASVALIIISPWSLLIIAIGALPNFIIEWKTGKNRYLLWEKNAEFDRVISAKTTAVSNNQGILENKLNNALGYFIQRIFHLNKKITEETIHLDKQNMKWDMGGEVTSGISLGFGIWLVVRKILVGASAVGSLVFSMGVISQFQIAVTMLLRSVGRIGEHSKNINQVLDILEMKSYTDMNPNGKKIEIDPTHPLTVEFKNVSFGYPGKDITVLKNVNLSITKGKNVAIVGLNGAGKTTLMKLLTRVYDPTEGEILVNGINLKEYSLESWHHHLAMLSQDYLIYSEETVRENIMLGNLTVRNEESVYSAARLATANTFISELKDKYDQKIGNDFKGGVELSKGQKQKLAIARTWYRRAPFLILDEPTAAIDAVSEDTIFKNLFEHPEEFGYKPTIIVISHKFSNVRKADNIIVLEHGSIAEQGTHDALMNKNGRYAELFKIQAEGFKA